MEDIREMLKKVAAGELSVDNAVLELKKDADVEKIKNILYKKTKLEDTYGVNMLAIADGRPETLNLLGILKNYLDFFGISYFYCIYLHPFQVTVLTYKYLCFYIKCFSQ